MSPESVTHDVYRGDIDEAAATRFQRASVLAWDIETSGLDWRSARIATCQLHSRDAGSAVVVITDATPVRLCSLLESSSVRKIFHHAMFDLRFMRYRWQAAPSNVACTKIASKLLYKELDASAHSLKPLLSRTLGVEIDKSEQCSDWLSSELTNSQLNYAVRDVLYLEDLFDYLYARLADVGLKGVFEGCLAHLPTRVELDLAGYGDVFTY